MLAPMCGAASQVCLGLANQQGHLFCRDDTLKASEVTIALCELVPWAPGKAGHVPLSPSWCHRGRRSQLPRLVPQLEGKG